MDNAQTIIDCIRKITGTFQKMNTRLIPCEVLTVDEDKKLCTAKEVGGETETEIANIKLSMNNNDGFFQVPAVGSNILVGKSETKDYYIILAEDIDAFIIVIDESNFLRYDKNGWVFNDGLNGGIMKLTPFFNDFNVMILNINTQLSAISAGIAGAGGSYVPVPLNILVKATYEDTKIKH